MTLISRKPGHFFGKIWKRNHHFTRKVHPFSPQDLAVHQHCQRTKPMAASSPTPNQWHSQRRNTPVIALLPPSPNSAWSTPSDQTSRLQDPIGTKRRRSEPPTCEPNDVFHELPNPSAKPTEPEQWVEYQHYYYVGYNQRLYDENPSVWGNPNQMWSPSGVEEAGRPQDQIGTKPKKSKRLMWEPTYAHSRGWGNPNITISKLNQLGSEQCNSGFRTKIKAKPLLAWS